MPTRLLRLLSLSLLALLLAAAPAAAGFAPVNEPIVEAEQLSATGFDSDAQGNSLVAWSQQKVLGAPDEVRARRVTATGEVGPVIEIAPGLIGYRPAVAMTPGGRAFVAWRELIESEPDSIKGRWVEPDGPMGPVLTLAKGEAGVEDALNPMAVVAPSGIVTVAWENEDKNTLELRRVNPDSTLGPLVEDVGNGGVTGPVIAALPDGSTVAVWRNGGTEKNVVTAANGLGTVEQISETSIAADNQIAVDPAGNSLVVWRQHDPPQFAVRGRLLDPKGLPVGPELAINPLEEGFVGSQPKVTADSAGNFLVTWSRQIGGVNTIFARALNSAGVFAGAEQVVSTPGVGAGANEALLLNGGVGAVAWRDDITGNPVVGRAVNGLGAPAGAPELLFSDGFGPELVTSAPAAGIGAFALEYAVSGSAQGLVVRRFMVPPICSPLAATVVQGAPVSVPISCTGPALEGARLISQARHGIVSAFNPLINGFVYTPLPGYQGSDSFTYAGVNDGGDSVATEVTIAVGKETTKPVVKKLRYIRKGKKFRLVLSEPAKAVIRLKSVTRKDGKRRIKLVGKIVREQAPRKVTIKARGKLAKKLAAGGKFRAVAVATDLAKNKSKPKRISFRLNG
jgi:hypothetical protein